MKIKNYETKILIIVVVIVIFIVEITSIGILNTIKIIEYKNYSMIVLDKNRAMVYISSKDKNIWYKNKYLYINNTKVKYNIEEITKDNNYMRFIIKLKFPPKQHTNDIITISIEDKRINIIKIINRTWGGD